MNRIIIIYSKGGNKLIYLLTNSTRLGSIVNMNNPFVNQGAVQKLSRTKKTRQFYIRFHPVTKTTMENIGKQRKLANYLSGVRYDVVGSHFHR